MPDPMYSMEYRGLGGRFSPGANRYAAALIGKQNYNNGTHAGGIASMAQNILQAMLLKGEMDQEQKAAADMGAANSEMVRGMTAQPWKNPDMGGAQTNVQEGTGKIVPTGPAGGYEGGIAALSNLQGNPYAGKLSSQLMMAKAEQDAKARDTEQAFQNAVKLKGAPGWEKPERLLPGRDVPYAPEVADQLTQIAAARAAAAQQPPVGYTPTPEGLTPTPGGPSDPATIAAQEAARKKAAAESAAAKPVPAAIIKMEREDRDAINTVQGINENLTGFIQMIDSGKLKLGPVENKLAEGKNYFGQSDESSRNYASFRSGLEKLRNDSLRLNNGVQTDGDAQRAWNELIANINDPQVVRQRLSEIQMLNQRAAALKQQNLTGLYAQYPALEMGSGQPAPQQAAPAVANADDPLGLRR